MTSSTWNIFFDMHGVLIDIVLVRDVYINYLRKILVPAGIPADDVVKIHDQALARWRPAFYKLNQVKENVPHDAAKFMEGMARIDRDWEEYIASFIPPEKLKEVKPRLHTPVAEYEAVATSEFPIAYPDVPHALEKVCHVPNITMHIASSASSSHVRGVVDLHGWQEYFTTLIGYDTLKAPKKARNGYYFKEMLQITSALPEKSIFIGDSTEEALLAINNGMDYVMIDRKGISNEDVDHHMDRVDYPVLRSLDSLSFLVREIIASQ